MVSSTETIHNERGLPLKLPSLTFYCSPQSNPPDPVKCRKSSSSSGKLWTGHGALPEHGGNGGVCKVASVHARSHLINRTCLWTKQAVSLNGN